MVVDRVAICDPSDFSFNLLQGSMVLVDVRSMVYFYSRVFGLHEFMSVVLLNLLKC
jgi:hypothetical protein